MKKYTIIAFALMLVIGFAPLGARAEEGTNTSEKPKWPFGAKKEVRERMEDRREKELFEKKVFEKGEIPTQEEMEKRREERLKEMKEGGIRPVMEGEDRGNKFGHMKQIALKAHVLNFKLENLVGRFQARIDKLEEMGVDVSKADAQMAVVKDAISDAKAKIEALKALAPADDEDDSDEGEDDTQAVDSARMEAKEAVKAVHEEMKNLILILRSYKIESGTTATSNASVTTE